MTWHSIAVSLALYAKLFFFSASPKSTTSFRSCISCSASSLSSINLLFLLRSLQACRDVSLSLSTSLRLFLPQIDQGRVDLPRIMDYVNLRFSSFPCYSPPPPLLLLPRTSSFLPNRRQMSNRSSIGGEEKGESRDDSFSVFLSGQIDALTGENSGAGIEGRKHFPPNFEC